MKKGDIMKNIFHLIQVYFDRKKIVSGKLPPRKVAPRIIAPG